VESKDIGSESKSRENEERISPFSLIHSILRPMELSYGPISTLPTPLSLLVEEDSSPLRVLSSLD